MHPIVLGGKCRLRGCIHHLLLLGRAVLVLGACWEPPASGEASGQMPGKEKHNNLEQLQNTCPKSTTRSFLEAPASPQCSFAGCPGQEVGCVLSALLSSFQDPRPAQERAGTFLCWAEHSSVLSSGTALPRSLPATSGWNQQPHLAGTSGAGAGGKVRQSGWLLPVPWPVLRGQCWPGSHISQPGSSTPEAVSALPAQGVARRHRIRSCAVLVSHPRCLCGHWGSLASWYYFRSLRPEENWRLDKAWLKGGL